MLQGFRASQGFDRLVFSGRNGPAPILGVTALAAGLLGGFWFANSASVEASAPKTAAIAPTNPLNPYGSALVRLRVDTHQRVAVVTEEKPQETVAPQQVAAAAPAAVAAPAPVAEETVPLPPVADFRVNVAENAPLPPRRPAGLTANLQSAEQAPAAPAPARVAAAPAPRGKAAPAVATADNRSFFEKLFGGAQRPAGAQPTGQALAYAGPETTGGLFSGLRSPASNPAARYDGRTAIYDISAHMVYMPNGARLEAHSGLGARLDDPRYVHERMHGATPPHTYELTLRESLFHGVQALRLNPVGPGHIFGRAGLLAHTYMLGPNGDSNGCVSFRNYDAFLQAYQRGEVKRLVVVARLD